jgi:hypothetical protein
MKSWAQRFSRTSKLQGSTTTTDGGSITSTTGVGLGRRRAALPATCAQYLPAIPGAVDPTAAPGQTPVKPSALTGLLHHAVAPAGPSSSSRRQQAQQKEASGSRHGGSVT